MIYLPEPEGATRLAQQLCQLAKGSARVGHRVECDAADLTVARRAGLDSIPTARRRILAALIDDDDVGELGMPRTTQTYASEDLQALGLLDKRKAGGYMLAKATRVLVDTAELRASD